MSTFRAGFGLFGLLLISINPSAAHATGRTISLPPVAFATTHGGTAGGSACVTADMGLPTSSYIVGSGTGVMGAYHEFTFNLKNLSSIPQHVTLQVAPGSRTKSQNSLGQPAPITTGPSVSFTQQGNLPFLLAGGAAATMTMRVSCQQDGCWIAGYVLDPDGNQLSAMTMAGSTTGGATTLTCLQIDSVYNFSIKIDEDRGAVSGNFTTTYHRNLGLVDKAMSSIPQFPLNGGRPF